MADVFLSYVREDRSRADQLVTVLGQLGLNVWWDEKILPGRPYREVIADELASAKCVVVLWSRASVRSDYVCDEAEEAKHRLVLVPVLIEQVKPPHGFRQQNLADLIAWTGDPDDPQFTLLRKAILSHVLPRAAEVSSTPSASKPPVPAKNVRTGFSHPVPTRHFESDVFISFAHFDDQAAIQGQSGWVTSLHRALEVRLGQLLGRQPRIWRDQKLQGNDYFEDRIFDRLKSAAVFVSVLSSRYAKSEWARREVTEFLTAATLTGGIQVADRLRILKIVKAPVPRALEPDALQSLNGYNFYTSEPDTDLHLELGPMSPVDVQPLYWMKVDEVAHDIAALLMILEEEAGS